MERAVNTFETCGADSVQGEPHTVGIWLRMCSGEAQVVGVGWRIIGAPAVLRSDERIL